jgi:anti-sigma regulatory factor (Ser/Thr protein kinase)
MQHLNANRSVEMVLPNVLGYERIAMACSAAFAQLQGLPPSRVEDLKTIVAEASTNAMEHGNGGRAEAHVTIRFERMPDAIKVTVADEGRGFDNTIRDPDIERIIDNLDAPIGFGLFLIRNLADDVAYALSPEGGHRVEMRIALQP